jgi:hypothetical protein
VTGSQITTLPAAPGTDNVPRAHFVSLVAALPPAVPCGRITSGCQYR